MLTNHEVTNKTMAKQINVVSTDFNTYSSNDSALLYNILSIRLTTSGKDLLDQFASAWDRRWLTRSEIQLCTMAR